MNHPTKPGFPPMCPHRTRCELGEKALAVFHNWANGCADFEPMDQDHAAALVAAIREALISQWEEHAALLAEAEAAKAAAVAEAQKLSAALEKIQHYEECLCGCQCGCLDSVKWIAESARSAPAKEGET